MATIVAAVALCLAPGCAGGGGGAGSGNPALVDLITASMPSGTTGVWYEVQLDAEFPNPPGLYLMTGGALPPGLSLDRVTGLISGFPRAVGVFTFSIAARDGHDPDLPPGRDANFAEDRQQFTMQVFRGPPHILPQVVPSAQYRAAYSYFIDIAGGTAPYTWAVTGGTLPAGITLNPNTGELCCLPTGVNPAFGNPPFQFQVTATDSAFPVPLQDTENLELQVVVLPLTIATPSPIQGGAINFPYDVVLLLASAGAGAPYTWSQQFPLGAGEIDLSTINMTISSDGHVRNISAPGPTGAPGTYLFTAKVIDEAGQIATRQYSLTLSVGPVVTGITPTKSSSPGPFTITGLNFQPGATVIFKPGPTQNSPLNPNVVNSTTITFPTAPPPPGGLGGYVTVRVRNPDGGYGDLLNAFAFPAASLTFNTTAAFPATQSPLSSTGLDVADVNKDGFADVVHSGSNAGQWGVAVGTAGGIDLLINAPPGGVFNNTNPAFTKQQLAIGGDWHGVKFHDVNTDGWLDVVATGDISGFRSVRTWLSSGGTFTPGTFTTTQLPHQGNIPPYNLRNVTDMALGRIDGDGAPDLVYAYQDGWDFQQGINSGTTYYGYQYAWYSVTGIIGGSVQTIRGLGNGAFSSLNLASTGKTLLDVTSVGAVGVGMFDPDQKADVAVGDAVGAAMSWNYGIGNQTQLGQFSITSATTSTFGTWSPLSHPAGGTNCGSVMSVAVGDINGDLRDDIVFPEETGFYGASFGGPGTTQNLISFSGNGSGGFSELPSLKPTARLRHAAILDGDFDAALDLVASAGTGTLANTGTWNRIEIFRGRTGNLGLQARQTLTVSTGSPNLGEVRSGDISGDGRPDIVATMSFFHPDVWTAWNFYNYGQVGYSSNWQNRGNGGTMGVVFFYNASQ
jgi:hypothetical protein